MIRLIETNLDQHHAVCPELITPMFCHWFQGKHKVNEYIVQVECLQHHNCVVLPDYKPRWHSNIQVCMILFKILINKRKKNSMFLPALLNCETKKQQKTDRKISFIIMMFDFWIFWILINLSILNMNYIFD